MAARRAESTRPGWRSGWVAALGEAVVSAAVVVGIAWYAVAHTDSVYQHLQALAPGWRGLATLAIMWTAGGLLARAFGRAEDAMRARRGAHRDDQGGEH